MFNEFDGRNNASHRISHASNHHPNTNRNDHNNRQRQKSQHSYDILTIGTALVTTYPTSTTVGALDIHNYTTVQNVLNVPATSSSCFANNSKALATSFWTSRPRTLDDGPESW